MASRGSSANPSGEVKLKIKSDAKKFFEAIRNSTDIFPEAMSNLYASIKLISNDASGIVRRIEYGPDSPTTIKRSTEKITHSSWPVFSYEILDGDILKYYTSFVGNISVVDGDDGSWAKWTWETGTRKDQNGIQGDLEDIARKTLRELDDRSS